MKTVVLKVKKKKSIKSNGNKENESIRSVVDVTQNEYIGKSFDSSGSKKM